MWLTKDIIEKCKGSEVEVEHEGFVFSGQVLTFLFAKGEKGELCVAFSIKLIALKKSVQGCSSFPEGWMLDLWVNRVVNLNIVEPRNVGPRREIIGGEDGIRFSLPGETFTFYPQGKDSRVQEEFVPREKNAKIPPAS